MLYINYTQLYESILRRTTEIVILENIIKI